MKILSDDAINQALLNELDCRILARACGLMWHHLVSDKFGALDHYTCSCGKEYVSKGAFYEHLVRSGVTFTTADDWELVRQKVVEKFWQFGVYIESELSLKAWLGLTPKECCQEVCYWIKSRHDLFPWLVELM